MADSMKLTLKAYFDNESNIDFQKQSIAATGKGGAGIAQTYLNGLTTPIAITDQAFGQVENLFAYVPKEVALEPLLLERERLARKITYLLVRIPNKKLLYTRKVSTVNPSTSKDVVVALWYDGKQLVIQDYKP